MIRSILWSAGLGLAVAGQAGAQAPVESPAAVRAGVAAWLQQERQVAELDREARERSQTVERLLQVLRVEEEALEAAVKASESAVSLASEERTRLQAERDALRASVEVLASALPALEERVRVLVPQLPAPLQELVSPLYQRLDREGSSSSERLQNVIGILMQVDRFARAITAQSSMQDVGGRSVEVTTLYVGLAFALFSDESGTHAGFLRPGPEGWQTVLAPEQAEPIRQAMQTYRDPQLASFVSLPVEIN